MTKLVEHLQKTGKIFISITGLTLRSPWRVFHFYRYAFPSFQQARTSEGNLLTDARKINGIRHTLTVWESKRHMLAFVHSGVHKSAIGAFPRIATGKLISYESDRVPTWEEIPQIFHERGVEYIAPEER